MARPANLVLTSDSLNSIAPEDEVIFLSPYIDTLSILEEQATSVLGLYILGALGLSKYMLTLHTEVILLDMCERRGLCH